MLVRRELTERVIGFAIDVHKQLGPRLLESIYEECLCKIGPLLNLNVVRLKDGLRRFVM